MNRYEILIKKSDQYFSKNMECSCVSGCWRMNFSPRCFHISEIRQDSAVSMALRGISENQDSEPVQVLLPNKRSESKTRPREQE